MALTTAVCNSFKKEVLDGVHQPGDTYKIALVKAGAQGVFGKDTANLSELGSDEASGTGYVAGGIALTGRVSGLAGDTAYVDWDDAVWPVASISADGALLYNASRGNKAVQVIAFSDTQPVPVSSTNAAFTVLIPSSGTGQIRMT